MKDRPLYRLWSGLARSSATQRGESSHINCHGPCSTPLPFPCPLHLISWPWVTWLFVSHNCCVLYRYLLCFVSTPVVQVDMKTRVVETNNWIFCATITQNIMNTNQMNERHPKGNRFSILPCYLFVWFSTFFEFFFSRSIAPLSLHSTTPHSTTLHFFLPVGGSLYFPPLNVLLHTSPRSYFAFVLFCPCQARWSPN